MRLNRIRDDLVRCGINSEICRKEFVKWKTLPRVKGCYSIWQGDISIYVGKAGGKNGLPDRFFHHHAKAFGKVTVEHCIQRDGFITESRCLIGILTAGKLSTS